MARTEEFTVEQVAAALEKTRGKLYLAARALHCNPNTLTRYIKRYKELKAVMEAARELRVDIAEVKLEDGVDHGQPWAVLYTLSTIGKHRGYTQKDEHAHEHTLRIVRMPHRARDAKEWQRRFGPPAEQLGDGSG